MLSSAHLAPRQQHSTQLPSYGEQRKRQHQQQHEQPGSERHSVHTEGDHGAVWSGDRGLDRTSVSFRGGKQYKSNLKQYDFVFLSRPRSGRTFSTLYLFKFVKSTYND